MKVIQNCSSNFLSVRLSVQVFIHHCMDVGEGLVLCAGRKTCIENCFIHVNIISIVAWLHMMYITETQVCCIFYVSRPYNFIVIGTYVRLALNYLVLSSCKIVLSARTCIIKFTMNNKL